MSKKPRKRTRKPSPTPPRAVKAWVQMMADGTMSRCSFKPPLFSNTLSPVYVIPAAAVDAENKEWQSLWAFFNWFASSKSQDQIARAEPLAVLGELYQRLAIIDQQRKTTLGLGATP